MNKWLTDIKNPYPEGESQSNDISYYTWQECMDTVTKAYEEKRCEHCGAGDDAHHSYTCPTGLHADRESRSVELASEIRHAIDDLDDDACDQWFAVRYDKWAEEVKELLEDRDE